MPKLSIIVPIYNGEKYLKKCLDSILAQTYTDFELILVDDGSKDNSLEICREYERLDSRVVVFHKENAGLVAARKSGVSIASGEYIGFVDCDDFINEDMYSQLMGSALSNHADITVSELIVDYSDHSVRPSNLIPSGYYEGIAVSNEIIPKMLTHSGFMNFGIIPGVVVKVFKKEILENALPKVPDIITNGEDVAITAHSFVLAQSVSVIESAAYHYIQYDDSMIHKFNPNRFEHVCNLYNCLINVDNEDYQKQIPLYMSWLIWGVVAECIKKSGYGKQDIRNYVSNILNNEITRKCLNSASRRGLPFKDKIKLFLMKHKMIDLLVVLVGGKR